MGLLLALLHELRQSCEYKLKLAKAGLSRGRECLLYPCQDYVERPELEAQIKSFFGKPGHFLVVFGNKECGKSTTIEHIATEQGKGTPAAWFCHFAFEKPRLL